MIKNRDFILSVKSQNEKNNLHLLQSKFKELCSSKIGREAKRFLYDTLDLNIQNEIAFEDFTLIFDEILKNFFQFVKENITDILWLICYQYQGDPVQNENQIKTIKKILNFFLEKNVLKVENLLEKFEENSLSIYGIINDQISFRKNITRINTKITYEQQKYNLLREESEGFSKLITLLIQIGKIKNFTEKEIKIFLDKIVNLIGFFDLDPVRVIDIALEAYKQYPFNDIYIKVFNMLNKEALVYIIKMKIQNIETNKNDNFYIVLAQLIKYSIVDLNVILSFLSIEDISKEYSNNQQKIKTFVKTKLNELIVNDLRPNVPLNKLEDNSEDNNSENKTSQNYICNFSKILNELNKFQNNTYKNKILNLFEGMVKIKDKINIYKLYHIIQNSFDIMSNPSLVKSICELIEWMIQPLISTDSKTITENISNEYSQINNFQDFCSNIIPLLKILSLGLYTEQSSFHKLLKVISSFSKNLISSYSELSELLLSSIFPTLSLIDAPSSSSLDLLWSIISTLPYHQRYSLYKQWLTQVYSNHPFLYLKYLVVKKQIAKWQKVMNKENMRHHGKHLGMMSSSNPLIVFEYTIEPLLSYKNLIPIFIGSLSYCSNLALDTIGFILSATLYKSKGEIVDMKILQIESVYIGLGMFIGSFYKKYYTVDISPILVHIISSFKGNPFGMEIYLLQQILEYMSGIKSEEVLSRKECASLCGGLFCYMEAIKQLKELKYFKRPSQLLMKFISEQNKSNSNFLIYFLVLFLINKQKILYSGKPVKICSYLKDQIQFIFNQLVCFIKFYMVNKENNFESFSYKELVVNYHISSLDIYKLIRFTIPPIYSHTEEKYNQLTNYFKEIFDLYQSTLQSYYKKEYKSFYISSDEFNANLFKNIWEYIPQELFFIFNSLELKDIFTPYEDAELKAMTAERDKLLEDYKKRENDKEYKESKEAERLKKDIDKLNILIENVNLEINEQKQVVKSTLAFMKTKANDLFKNIDPQKKKDIPYYLMQYLVFPRMIQSKNDAIFCSKFLINLIMLNNPMINALDIIQLFNKLILSYILTVTENEAYNIGISVNEFLVEIKQWQDDQKFWNEHCKDNPSFSRKIDSIDIVDFKDFQKAYDAILSQMSIGFKNMFEVNEEYLTVRNGITVLNLISDFLPNDKDNANDLVDVLKKCHDKFKQYEDAVLIERFKDNIVLKIKSGKIGHKSRFDLRDIKDNKDDKKYNDRNKYERNDRYVSDKERSISQERSEKRRRRERSRDNKNDKNDKRDYRGRDGKSKDQKNI